MSQFSPKKEELAQNLTTILKKKGNFNQCVSRYLREIATQIDIDGSSTDNSQTDNKTQHESQIFMVEFILQYIDKNHLVDSLTSEKIQENPELIQRIVNKWTKQQLDGPQNDDPLRNLLDIIESEIKSNEQNKKSLSSTEKSEGNGSGKNEQIQERDIPLDNKLNETPTKSSSNKEHINEFSSSSFKGSDQFPELVPKILTRKMSPTNSKSARASSPKRYTFGLRSPTNNDNNQSPFNEVDANSNKDNKSVSSKKSKSSKTKVETRDIDINENDKKSTSSKKSKSSKTKVEARDIEINESDKKSTSSKKHPKSPKTPIKVSVDTNSPPQTKVTNGVIEVMPQPIEIHRSKQNKNQKINIEFSIHVARNPPPGSPGGYSQPSVVVTPTKMIKRKKDNALSSSSEVIHEEITAYIPKQSPKRSPKKSPKNENVKSDEKIEDNVDEKTNEKVEEKINEKSEEKVNGEVNERKVESLLLSEDSDSSDSDKKRTKVMKYVNEIRLSSPRMPRKADGFTGPFTGSGSSSAAILHTDSSEPQKQEKELSSSSSSSSLRKSHPKKEVVERDIPTSAFTTDAYNHISDYAFVPPNDKFIQKDQNDSDSLIKNISSSGGSSKKSKSKSTKSNKEKKDESYYSEYYYASSSESKGKEKNKDDKVDRDAKSPSKIAKVYLDSTTQTAHNIATQTSDETLTILYLNLVEAEFQEEALYSCFAKVNGIKRRTISLNSSTPKWSKQCSFNVYHIFGDEIVISVSKDNEQDFANLVIPLKKVALDDDIDQWFDLLPSGKGKIHLIISAVADYGTKPLSENSSTSGHHQDDAEEEESIGSSD